MSMQITQAGESNLLPSEFKTSNFLPDIFKTEINQEFLKSTLDQLMSQGTLESVNSFWGRIRGSSFMTSVDVFNKENAIRRENFQFAPGWRLNYPEREQNISFIKFLNQLEKDGFASDQTDSFMSGTADTMDFHIDLSKFSDYKTYYWLPGYVPVCNIQATVGSPIDIDDVVQFNYYTTPVLENSKTLTLLNDMQIVFVGDNVTSTSGDFETDTVYMVKGVGTSVIQLIPMYTLVSGIPDILYTIPFVGNLNFGYLPYYDNWKDYPVDQTVIKDYLTVEKGGTDQWGRSNYWYHIDLLKSVCEFTGLSIDNISDSKFQAKYPIIEYKLGIQLNNQHVNTKFQMDWIVDGVSLNDFTVTATSIEFGDIQLALNDKIMLRNFSKIYQVENTGSALALVEIFSSVDFELKDGAFAFNTNIQTVKQNIDVIWDGEHWQSCQIKDSQSKPMLFDLYDELREDTGKSGYILDYDRNPYLVVNPELGFAATVVNGVSQFKIGDIDHQMFMIDGEVKSLWVPMSIAQRTPKSKTIIVPENNAQFQFEISQGHEFQSNWTIGVTDSGVNWFAVDQQVGAFPVSDSSVSFYYGMDNQITYLNAESANDVLGFTDPAGNQTGIQVTQSGPIYSVVLTNDYVYDTLYYTTGTSEFSGVITVANHMQSTAQVKINGRTSDDWTIQDNNITIGQPLKINDIIDVTWLSSESFDTEVPDGAKFNSLNDLLPTTILYSDIESHVANQLQSSPSGDNYWLSSRDHTHGGFIRRQHHDVTNLVTSEMNQDYNIFQKLKTIETDYSIFKTSFNAKVKQLWRSQVFDSVSELVDQALQEISAGKQEDFKYSDSDMLYFNEYDSHVFPPDFLSYVRIFAIPEYNPTDFVYSIYITIAGVQRILRKDIDYTIDSSSGEFNINISSQLADAFITTEFDDYILQEDDISFIDTEVPVLLSEIEVKIYERSVCFIPYSSVKLGLTGAYDVLTRNKIIQCHDGSTHSMTNTELFDTDSMDFDVVAAALYDMEVRIKNNIQYSHATVEKYKIELINSQGVSATQLFAQYMKNEFLEWKSTMSIDDITPIAYMPGDNTTWNFKLDNEYGIAYWKQFYQLVFGTSRPDSHPWELFGLTAKPNDWDSRFSWTDPAKRIDLIKALKIGNPVDNIPNPRIAFSKWDSEISQLVDASGNLLLPLDLDVVSSPDPIDASILFVSGDGTSPEETQWMNSSGYQFALVRTIAKMRPSVIFNDLWNVSGNSLSASTSTGCEESQLDLTYSLGASIIPDLTEFYNDADISIKVLSDYLTTANVIHMGGFTTLNNIGLQLDGSYQSGKSLVAADSFNLSLEKSIASPSIIYSGVKLVKTINNAVKVYGYDSQADSFQYLMPMKKSKNSAVSIGDASVLNYSAYDIIPTKMAYGTEIRKRQDLYDFLMGLSKYYESIGFTDMNWHDQATLIIQWSLDSADNDNQYINGLDNQFGFQLSSGMVDNFKSDTGSKMYSRDLIQLDMRSVLVIRNEQLTDIKLQTISEAMLIELDIVEYEHLIAINSRSSSDDLIYDPVIGLGNHRIKCVGKRTRNWNGRLEAPGYIVTDQSLINSFESANREITHDVNQSAPNFLNPLTGFTGAANIGFQKKSYLELMTPNARFLFDKERNRIKGTTQSLEAFVKNQNVFNSGANGEAHEEWLIRMGSYGDVSSENILEFSLEPGLAKTSPQLIRLSGTQRKDQTSDLIIDVSQGDNRYVSGDFMNFVPMISSQSSLNNRIAYSTVYENWNRKAGTPLLTEADFYLKDTRQLESVYDTSADYATISTWNANFAYIQGDIVRYSGKVHKLVIDSTGVSPGQDILAVKGNVTFPIVPSGTSLVLGSAPTVQDDVTFYTIPLTKASTGTSYNNIQVVGTRADPSVPSGTLFNIDGNTITLSKSQSNVITTSAIITGDVLNPVIEGSTGKKLSISGATIDFESFINTFRNVTALDILSDGLEVFDQTTGPDLALARIEAIDSLRTKYISENSNAAWGNWINAYFNSDYSVSGLNTEYLETEIAAITTETYEQDMTDLLQNDIDIINLITGESYTIATLPISALDEQEAIAAMVAFDYMSNLSSKYKTGDKVTANLVITSESVVAPKVWKIAEIVERINQAFAASQLTRVTASATSDLRLRITKVTTTLDLTLVLSADTANEEVGFPAAGTTATGAQSTQNQTINLTLADVVSQINTANISGISAQVASSSTGSVLKVISANIRMSIGDTAFLSIVGISAGDYVASSSEVTVDVELTLFDVIKAINDFGLPNILAKNINNTILIETSNFNFVVGNGSANIFLGLREVERTLSGIVSNEFTEEDWELISDPLNFSAWVYDNYVSSVKPDGWNVYQTFDFNLEIAEICEGIESGDDVLITTMTPHNLRIGDYLIVVNSTSVPSVDGIHQVMSVINAQSFMIDAYIAQKGFVGKVMLFQPTRFTDTAALFDSLNDPAYRQSKSGWRPGMYAFVDSYIDDSGTQFDIPAVYQCVGDTFDAESVYFDLVRTGNDKVDNSILKNAISYVYDSQKTITELEVYDPAKGIIPGIADSELNFKNSYDTAVYNNTTDNSEVTSDTDYWAENFQGQTWWDQSNAVYIDYEQGPLEYRQGNWGKLFPTSTIDVYEWTKSPVDPESFNDYVASSPVEVFIEGIPLSGEPYYTFDEYDNRQYYWSESTTFNFKTGNDEVFYYFWVKNKTTIPNTKRLYSVLQIADIIENPNAYNVNWVASVSPDTILISNLEDCVPCQGAVIKLQFDKYTTEKHNEYLLLSEGGTHSNIPEWLHMGLRDSLAGRDKLTIDKKHTPWRFRNTYYPGDVVWFEGGYWITYQKHVAYTRAFLSDSNYNIITAENEYWLEIDSFSIPNSPIDSDNPWTEIVDYERVTDFSEYPISEFGYAWDTYGWDRRPWDLETISLSNTQDGVIRISAGLVVPDHNLHRFVRYGVDISPRQSWIIDLPMARKTAVGKLNRQFSNINLVDQIPDAIANLSGTIELGFHEYTLSDLWVYVDWSPLGLTYKSKTEYSVMTEGDISSIADATVGDLVKVKKSHDSDSVNRRTIFRLTPIGWEKVFKEKATVQFCSTLWDAIGNGFGWDNANFDINVYDLDTPRLFTPLLDMIRDKIFIGQYSTLYSDFWFVMLKYMLGEQPNLEWAIKSSYIKYQLNERLSTDDKVFKKYPYSTLMDYLNDTKPYRAKVRTIDDNRTLLEKVDMSGRDGLVIQINHLINPQLLFLAAENQDCLIDDNSGDNLSNENITDGTDPIITQTIIQVDNNNISYLVIDPTLDYQFTIASDIDMLATVIAFDEEIECIYGTGAGVMWMGSERIEFGYAIGNVIYDVLRGTNITTPMNHATGDIVFLKESPTVILTNVHEIETV